MHTLQLDIYPEYTEAGADPDHPIPSSGQARPPGRAKPASGLALSTIALISELG